MKRSVHIIICLFLTIVLAVSFCTTVTHGASKTVKSKVYTQCIKSGKYVYCNACNGIYKVNVKKGTKKIIASVVDPTVGDISSMKLYKGYIYYDYCPDMGGDVSCIYRVKKSGKSKKKLAEFNSPMVSVNYAIKGKKIYYTAYTDIDDDSSKINMQMKLDGKSKAKSKKTAKISYKKSNKKGYSILEEPAGEDTYKVYLKAPKKKIYVTTVSY